MRLFIFSGLFVLAIMGCKKSSTVESDSTNISLSIMVDGKYNGTLAYQITSTTEVKVVFTGAVNPSTVNSGLKFINAAGVEVPFNSVLSADNRTLSISPRNELASFETFTLSITAAIKSAGGGTLINPVNIILNNGFSTTDKFPRISDEELLTLVQRQTFKYFYDFGHPASGMARERNTSGNTVTSGGSGFGIMALVTGVHRNFITRAEGLARMQKIVGFLKTAERFKGAYPHWMDGNTGKALPFSAKDNGGDLVETSLLMQGLITARQYFTNANAAETNLRDDITALYNNVEWDWYRKDNGDVLFWHWSPEYNWDVNLPIRGWNECLITYVIAASSPTHSIPKSVYDSGWAQNGAIKNGNTYYGVQLPLGPANGGPMFFSHYSFLGLDPRGLADSYANYETQTRAHALINYNYAVANPKGFAGYGADNWGLTASDIPNGYAASSPSNDRGVIAPTAALGSFPYTPAQSMQALHFFYYKLGDKLFKEYGFVDAFSLHDKWFASSTLAIDQGPIIVMIENYRTQLLWNLFMSAPEVKQGLLKLGFSSPKL